MGGDWNLTLEETDRKNHTEKRTVLAKQLYNLLNTHEMIDVWRKYHPESKQFTYQGNQITSPKSRLDRIYIKKNWLQQTNSIEICPYFVDHAGLALNILPHKQNHRSDIWKIKNNLLNDKSFTEYMTVIIQYYSTLANEEEELNDVWDEMKRELKLQAQRYEENKRQRRNQQYIQIEQQIAYLTSKTQLNETEEQVLHTVGTTLKRKFQQDAKQIILQEYTLNQKEKNSCLPIFPSKGGHITQPQIHTVEINGKLETEASKIRTEVRRYYEELYRKKGNKPNINDDFYNSLPELNNEEKQKCDAQFTLTELTTALNNTNTGRAPGMDGLTYEFYKKFWKQIGPLLLRVANNGMEQEKLPNSMYQSMITLVPKKGNPTLLANWRPITLQNTDYKLITRCLANRITEVLPTLITTDQSYCVPKKTIHTNLHLIRDAIEYANQRDIPLAIISLDQASAFDQVEHQYIYHLLNKYGFGTTFIRNIKTLYNNTQGLIKLNGSLIKPFQYQRGVRQGDPLSGPLFTLTIEPFLLMCNKNLREYGLPLPPEDSNTLVTSAYADDVTVFISKEEGFQQLVKNFMIYGALSGAMLNIHKSTGLFVGRWRTRTDSPLGLQWSTQGEKYLGIYLGNTADWHNQNWTQLETKTQAILTQWEKVPHVTSYPDRKQILNQLIGAKLIHTLTILPPPPAFLDKMQKLMVKFIWHGKHWKHQSYVYATVQDGGIGVHHLLTRSKTLSFNFLQKFIASSDRDNARHLQEWNICKYECGLRAEDVLKLTLDPKKFQVMSPFYANALAAWHEINPKVNIQDTAELRSIPIRNSTLLKPHISGHNLDMDKAWSTINVLYIGQLIKENGQWKQITDFNTDQCTQPTIRRLEANLKAIEEFFRHHYPTLEKGRNPLTPNPLIFTIKQPNGRISSLPIKKK